VIGVVLLIAVAIWITSTLTAAAPKPVTVATPQALTAHGVVEPVAQASIATLRGGVVRQLPVQVGQTADAQQEVARIDQADVTEVLVAPWRGTVMGINVHIGDTIMAGTVVMTMGDLSAYQVETTDVDEYLIGHIKPNQAVTMTVEAVDRLQLRGFVRSVALQQRQSAEGLRNYPVVIALGSPNASLRPGMTVRITFLESPN
jgi:multidrug efflux pump subunit AcrA (membrane-fusion protein)